MEILTLLATTVTIILGGALARVGELVLDGSLEKLTNLIGAKSPDTLKKLQSANQNPALLPETIEVMATLLEDPEIQKVAEQVVKDNQSNPYVINQFTDLEKILNFANRDINIDKQINNFWLQPPVGEQVKQNPANLDTTSESSKSISTSLSNLDYGIESLCKLKAIFYKLKGDARQQEGKVNITVKQLSEWIQEIQSAESQFDQVLNLLEDDDDSDS